MLECRRAVMFTVVSMLLVGAYHVVLWGVGRTAFPDQAAGSLLRRADGTVIGSSLIAQRFTQAAYFQPRPSAVDYDAASTGGSNYGPSNEDYLKAVRERLDATVTLEQVEAAAVPSEMITASGAGLDPHIPPAAAMLQAPRVAAARHVTVARTEALIRSLIESPQWGFLGRPRVNVLKLTLALDEALGAPVTPESVRR